MEQPTCEYSMNPQHKHSMPKPEIQPLVPLVSRSIQINPPFLRTHSPPNPLPRLIPPEIIPLGEKKQPNSQNTDTDQNTVAVMIQRLIVFAVDVGTDDPAKLHAHVVARRRDGARPHSTRVARGQADEDRVAVGVA